MSDPYGSGKTRTGIPVKDRAYKIRQDWRHAPELLGKFTDEELVRVWSDWYGTYPDCDDPETYLDWLRDFSSRGYDDPEWEGPK